MRNLKELKAILTTLYCINRTSKHKDEDVENILKYAFYRILECNTNLLLMACIGKSKEDIMPEIKQILEEDTKYHLYMEKR